MKDGKPLKSYDEKVLRPKKGEPIVTTDGFTVGEGEFIVDFSQANTNNDIKKLTVDEKDKSKIMEILDNMKSTIKDLGLTWWYELNTYL